MRLGVTELIVIFALALVIFGGGKLSGIGKALGTSIREFKNEVGDKDANADDSAKNNVDEK